MSKHATAEDEDFISIKALCKKLSCSRAFVYTLIGRGLPRYKLEGVLRFKYSEVVKFIGEPTKAEKESPKKAKP